MIRLLLAGDVCLYRDALAFQLRHDRRLDVVGEADTAKEAVEEAIRLVPEAVLIDANMPEVFETVTLVRDKCAQTKIIAFNVKDSEHALLRSAAPGIQRILPRDATLDELVDVLASAVAGRQDCTRQMTVALLRRTANLAAAAQADARRIARTDEHDLTTREQEVVALLARGLSNKVIARLLDIELPTVKNHVHHILRKLHAHSRTEVVAQYRARVQEADSLHRL
jgi:DNA-binding NarL/FixJ family response regulator